MKNLERIMKRVWEFMLAIGVGLIGLSLLMIIIGIVSYGNFYFVLFMVMIFMGGLLIALALWRIQKEGGYDIEIMW